MILIEVRSSDSFCSTEKYTGIVTIVQVVEIDSRNLLVLLCITDCKYKGNPLKPYLPKKMTVAVLKMLVLECARAPSLVNPSLIPRPI